MKTDTLIKSERRDLRSFRIMPKKNVFDDYVMSFAYTLFSNLCTMVFCDKIGKKVSYRQDTITQILMASMCTNGATIEKRRIQFNKKNSILE